MAYIVWKKRKMKQCLSYVKSFCAFGKTIIAIFLTDAKCLALNRQLDGYYIFVEKTT